MKTRSTHFIMRTALPALCVFTTMTFLANRADANLLFNGDFETGDLTGWTCSGGTCPVTSADPYWMAVGSGFANSGTYALGIGASNYDTGNNPIYGSISQNVATTIGQTYVVTFAYGEDNNNQTLSGDSPCVAAGGPGPSGCYLDPANIDTSDPSSYFYQYNALSVLVNTGSAWFASDFLAYQKGLTSQGDFFYTTGGFSFVANSTSTALEFDGFDIQADVALDSIDVSAAPEPGTLGLLGASLVGIALFMRKRATRS